jgi:hypothetical protein
VFLAPVVLAYRQPLWQSFARMDISVDQLQKKRFNYGVALAWVPLVFLIPGLMNAFRGILSSKATGLGAVAGGIGEMLATFGFAAMLVFQIGAIVLLGRSFSKDHRLRSMVSVVSIFFCGMTVLILVAFILVQVILANHAM